MQQMVARHACHSVSSLLSDQVKVSIYFRPVLFYFDLTLLLLEMELLTKALDNFSKIETLIAVLK